MFAVNERIQVPDEELQFSTRAPAVPGGQNVNKVSSKAFLHWNLDANTSVPSDVMQRLRTLQRNRITVEGILVIQSQSFRDQEKNRLSCLEKLREFLLQAAVEPKKRKPSKPTRGSHQRRLEAKKRRSTIKSIRGRLNSDG